MKIIIRSTKWDYKGWRPSTCEVLGTVWVLNKHNLINKCTMAMPPWTSVFYMWKSSRNVCHVEWNGTIILSALGGYPVSASTSPIVCSEASASRRFAGRQNPQGQTVEWRVPRPNLPAPTSCCVQGLILPFLLPRPLGLCLLPGPVVYQPESRHVSYMQSR